VKRLFKKGKNNRNGCYETASGRTEKMEVQMNTAQKSGMLCKGREWKRCKGI
jgi:hypothetical protein